MFVYKIIILGESGIGKTSLMNKYVNGVFMDNDAPTIGIEFASKSVNMESVLKEDILRKYREEYVNKYYDLEKRIKLQIWNSSGQERFHSIVSTYYRNVNGVIFVCDLTRRETLDKIHKWIQDFNRNAIEPLDKTSGLIVGMKSDLRRIHNNGDITDEELKKFAEEYGLKSFTVSAKIDTVKIDNIFNEIINGMFQKDFENGLQNYKYDNVNAVYKLKIDKPIRKKDCCNLL